MGECGASTVALTIIIRPSARKSSETQRRSTPARRSASKPPTSTFSNGVVANQLGRPNDTSSVATRRRWSLLRLATNNYESYQLLYIYNPVSSCCILYELRICDIPDVACRDVSCLETNSGLRSVSEFANFNMVHGCLGLQSCVVFTARFPNS